MTSQAYDPGNIFAKILRGEIPSHRVYEDDDVVAFMDVMPQGTGPYARRPARRPRAISSTPTRRRSERRSAPCRKSPRGACAPSTPTA